MTTTRVPGKVYLRALSEKVKAFLGADDWQKLMASARATAGGRGKSDRARQRGEVDEIREELAAYAHGAWSRWMEYLFDQCEVNAGSGEVSIPADSVSRWERQLAKPYADLTAEEQQSDLAEADKIRAVLSGEEATSKALGEAAAAKAWADDWLEAWPRSGSGTFAIHARYEGLTDEQSKMDETELRANVDPRVAIWFSSDNDRAWGVAVEVGSGAALVDGSLLDGSGPVAASPLGLKPAQEIKPGTYDEGGGKFTRAIEVDSGTYDVGVWLAEFQEVRLRGEIVRGLFVLAKAPDGYRFSNATGNSSADVADLTTTIANIRSSGGRWLVWATPGQTPTLYDVQSAAPALKMKAGAVIGGSVPFKPLIAFVGASPTEFDALSGKLFSGPPGKTLNKQFIEPLGITRKDCALLNLVPVYLVNEDGVTRGPTDEEVADWSEQVTKSLDEIQPLITIALGSQAKRALGKRADLKMPHPVTLRHFTKSDEMRRKKKILSGLLTARLEKIHTEKDDQAADVSGAANRVMKVRVVKRDEEKRLTYGPVLIPGDVDAQDDTITKEEVEAACHWYMENSRVIGESHEQETDSVVVECYCSMQDMTLLNQLTGQEEFYPAGTWFIVAKHSPQTWIAIKRGDPGQGYSIGGFGKRERTK